MSRPNTPRRNPRPRHPPRARARSGPSSTGGGASWCPLTLLPLTVLIPLRIVGYALRRLYR